MNTSGLKFQLKHWVACGISTLNKKVPNEGLHRSLMYHSIDNPYYDAGNLYTLSVSKFKEQMLLIKRQYEVAAFSDTILNPGQMKVSVTFDDGYLDNFTEAMPFLLEQNIPFTVFMVSDFIAENYKEFLNKSHLQEMAKHKLITIGSHGKTHRPLSSLPIAEAAEELGTSKKILEDILGYEVTTMSFPHGQFNEAVLQEALSVGYKRCGTSVALPNTQFTPSYKVGRQAIFFCDSKLSLKQKLNGQWDWLVKE